jgi:putative membrane protein
MVTALAFSTIFLASYLYYHYHVGHVVYTGPFRPLYLSILVSHTILAVFNLPVILRTVYLAASGRFAEHKLAAHWAFPIWMYVSVTGVIVYLMLYRLAPAGV